MSRRIIYLINPIAGTRSKTTLEELIRKKTRRQGIECEIMTSHAQRDYQALRQMVQKENISDVVICGGDGTVNAVVAALKDLPLQFGIIPLGSGNGLAFTANIPRHPSQALELIFRGKSEWVDAFFINDKFSCMLCGIGFDAAVAQAFAKEKRRGLQTYIKTSMIQFFKAKPYRFEVILPDRTLETEAFFISIANSNQFGNNFRIAPKASLSDGLLDIVIVKKMSKMILPFSIISQVTGINALQAANQFIRESNIIYLQTPALTIRNPGLAPLHIDGDPGETSREFQIRIVKRCFRLIQ